MKVWTLTKLGADNISAKHFCRFLNHNTVVHDICLSEVRFMFEKLNFATDWISQNELKQNISSFKKGRAKDRAVVPDGLFMATFLGQAAVVALELELHTKSHKRYRNLFYDYAYMDAIGVILYVVKNASISVPIIKQWHVIRQKYKFKSSQTLLILELNDLIAGGSRLNVRDASGKANPLFDVFKTCQGLSNLSTTGLSGFGSHLHKQDQAFNDAPNS